jgi:hypothetical protein
VWVDRGSVVATYEMRAAWVVGWTSRNVYVTGLVGIGGLREWL